MNSILSDAYLVTALIGGGWMLWMIVMTSRDEPYEPGMFGKAIAMIGGAAVSLTLVATVVLIALAGCRMVWTWFH